MSGPIVRSGASPEFSKNWDRIFGEQSTGDGSKKAPKKPAKKVTPKAAKKPLPKKKSAKK